MLRILGKTTSSACCSSAISHHIRTISCVGRQTIARGVSISAATTPIGDSSGQQRRLKSSVAIDTQNNEAYTAAAAEIKRLQRYRNVGILAHVDAGKTTVTERMLALAGVVRNAGNVDDGSTLTDFLDQERERGISISASAISFDWAWHNNRSGDDYDANDKVRIQLIDTPGHVDFSVEVNRSVAVLDGAVLVVDAVAGVQAQTETVWRALTQPSLNNHLVKPREDMQDHVHEPLPCLAMINKMDKEGCHFGKAIQSLRTKLPGANPVPMQIPLFRGKTTAESGVIPPNIVALTPDDVSTAVGNFIGVVDLLHMRAIMWPETGSQELEKCIPVVIPLLDENHKPRCSSCQVIQKAIEARNEFIEALAEVDPATEEYYLNDEIPSNAELREGLRRATLSHRILPVMAGAALKGKGVEPLLDSIADLLPSPLDRKPPALTNLGDNCAVQTDENGSNLKFGHPLHPSLLALAFKVVHMKGRGGSGDGRVVFCRVYSGKIRERETVTVVSPPAPGELPDKPRQERIGGILELAGGRFDNMQDGLIQSGEVCAIVGLKSVVTGDTILLPSEGSIGKHKNKKQHQNLFCLAGVAAPKPVLTVRLEAETSGEQARLSEALKLLSIEDPSLVVEETESSTLLSGLGELHIEVTLDRLYREHGLQVMVGAPTVAFRETITEELETPGLLEYDRTIGGTRLQGAVQLRFTQNLCQRSVATGESCMLLSEPVVKVGPKVRQYLGVSLELTEDELVSKDEVVSALVKGCQGALKRGPLKSAAMANVTCHVEAIDAMEGPSQMKSLPGAMRAAAANAVAVTLSDNATSCTVLEPTMLAEITLPNDMVGSVLSDLTNRRGAVGDVLVGEEAQAKTLVRADVPLVEILGYATSLRSLTGGEGIFSAEYKGHSPC